MAFILEAVWEWIMAHVVGQCISIQVPDDVSLYADPLMVYEYLFADGVCNWGVQIGLHDLAERNPRSYKGLFNPLPNSPNAFVLSQH